MSKLVKIGTWLAVNPDHVVSVRNGPGVGDVTLELVNGTRHGIAKVSVAELTAIVNGETDESTG